MMRGSWLSRSRWISGHAIVLLAWLTCVVVPPVAATIPKSVTLAKNQDAFFIEDDLVYRRFLELSRDGTYRQINQARTATAEVDRGAWEQTVDGVVLLHFTCGAMRFHALVSGPLSITLNDPETIRALPTAADAIRRWLARGNDAVFAPGSAGEITLAPVALAVDPHVPSFRRGDLEGLARQIDDFVSTEQHRTFRLVPFRTPDGILLLIQENATFQATDLARVRAEHPVRRGQPPPFYFARVDAGTFAREAGNWQELR